MLSDPDTQVQALIGTMPNPANSRLATARMLVKPGDRQVTLVAQNLPKLPAEQNLPPLVNSRYLSRPPCTAANSVKMTAAPRSGLLQMQPAQRTPHR